MDSSHGGEGFSEQQRSSIDGRQADQDRTLEAMHRLEEALAEPAPRREADWRAAIEQALSVLAAATAEEAANAARPDSLLSDLAHNQPMLRNRTRALRLQYGKIQETIEALSQELAEHSDAGIDFADIRQRLGWLLTALRHQRARESDLIYEAYYDAFNTELRVPPDA